MQKIILDDKNFEYAIEEVAKIILNNGIAIVPTETVYGIITAYNNTAGREKIYEMKTRSRSQKLQMLAPSLEAAAKNGVVVSSSLKKIAAEFMPGEITVICPGKEEDTIGLRIPNHKFVLALLQKINCPIAATSANISGEPAASTTEEAIQGFTILPDIIIDGGKVAGESSTVVSILQEEPVILRQGPITIEQIIDALK